MKLIEKFKTRKEKQKDMTKHVVKIYGDVKICPNCGQLVTTPYCPKCGTKMGEEANNGQLCKCCSIG